MATSSHPESNRNSGVNFHLPLMVCDVSGLLHPLPRFLATNHSKGKASRTVRWSFSSIPLGGEEKFYEFPYQQPSRSHIRKAASSDIRIRT